MTAVKKAAPATKKSLAVSDVPDLITKPMKLIGREVLLKCPTLEQIVALEDICDELVEAEKSDQSYPEAKVLFNKYYRMINALMPRPEDKQWLEDGRIEGYITLRNPEVAQIPLRVVEMFKAELEAMGTEPANRSDRRAAARKKA